MNLLKQIDQLLPELIKIRRFFHQHPEPGTKEFITAKQICNYLDHWNIPYEYPVAETGIVAILTGQKKGSGNTVALRADMDALPLTESSACPYSSKTAGMMHACGHDAHMTIQLGVAKLLKEMEFEWSGCVKFFFQPAEETIGGAERMIAQGWMENPDVDFVTGLHVVPYYPAGHVELKNGKLNASSDDIIITVHGKSCHGAYPENGIDAIVLSAMLIQSLQTLVSRNISPLNNAVLSFGKIEGGTAGNIIADCVTLTGTLRTTDQATRMMAIETISRQVEHICQAYGGCGELNTNPGYAALINSDEIVSVLETIVREHLGVEHLHWKEFPSLGVEDFSFFLEKAPGVFYHLGCGNEEKGITAPLHNNRFDIDEDCLATGVFLQIMLTLELLQKEKG